MNILLVEPNYYTTYPPLGLLKLASYHKLRGDSVQLVQGCKWDFGRKPDRTYVTSLFTWGWREVHRCVGYYKALFPEAEVWLGGLYASLIPEHAKLSGADVIVKGIFDKVENLRPDYSLVPGWDASIMFASRGCPRRCKFCAVPKLEGKMNGEKQTIKPLISPGHRRIILWDNNILASRFWRDIFDELKEFGIEVDFNQGLDAERITEDVAQRLQSLKVHYIRLGYDLKTRQKEVKRAIELLRETGVSGRRILIYTLFNFEDTPEDFFERVREILNWGAVCYPMRFEPLNALEKNKYVAPGWELEKVEAIQRARRVIGYGGAFPPYKGLVAKFNRARGFDEAFSLRPLTK